MYARVVVDTALRVAQARIANQARIEPETLSVPRLVPKIAAASACSVTAEIQFNGTADATLVKPDWGDLPLASTRLGDTRIEKTGPLRRKCRFGQPRGIVRSLPRSPRDAPASLPASF